MTQPSVIPEDEQRDAARLARFLPWKWPVGIWLLVIAGGVMLLPFAVRALMLAGVPPMDDPFDVEKFVEWGVPTEENAFTDYLQAARLREQAAAQSPEYGPATFDDVYQLVVGDQGWAAADEPLKQWLERHRAALMVWKRGTDREHGRYLVPDFLDQETPLQTYQELRAFPRIARLESSRCIYEGRLDEAWQWTRAAYRSGGHTSYRACITQGMIGMAIHSMSTVAMSRWAEQPGVTSRQLKAALGDIKADYALYELPSNILKAEYLAMRNTMLSPKWDGLGLDPDSSAGMVRATKCVFWLMGRPEYDIRVLRQVLANQIAEIDKPVSTRRKMVGTGLLLLFDSDPAVPLPRGRLDLAGINRGIERAMMVKLAMPQQAYMDTGMLRQAARQAAIETVLATQAYRRDHGEFPQTLQQLVPEFLDAVPLDPFNPAGGPLKYRRDEPTRAVVWSVGINRTDDGGVVEDPKGNSPDVGISLK